MSAFFNLMFFPYGLSLFHFELYMYCVIRSPQEYLQSFRIIMIYWSFFISVKSQPMNQSGFVLTQLKWLRGSILDGILKKWAKNRQSMDLLQVTAVSQRKLCEILSMGLSDLYLQFVYPQFPQFESVPHQHHSKQKMFHVDSTSIYLLILCQALTMRQHPRQVEYGTCIVYIYSKSIEVDNCQHIGLPYTKKSVHFLGAFCIDQILWFPARAFVLKWAVNDMVY